MTARIRPDGVPVLSAEQRSECNIVESKPGISLAIARRNKTVEMMGFRDYGHYLNSKLWKTIRFAVMDECCCYVCDRQATSAHHISYSIDTLEGCLVAVAENIIPVCDRCHERIHFKGEQFLAGKGAVRRLKKLMKKHSQHST